MPLAIKPRRDLIDEVQKGIITAGIAEALCEEAIAHYDHLYLGSAFGLTEAEATAFLQGANITQLVKWRVRGWPDHCSRCGMALVVEDYGWVVSDGAEDQLLHVNCFRER